MPRKCHRCGGEGHRERNCPRKRRLHVVPDPEPRASAPAPAVSDPWDLSHQPLDTGKPDLSAAYAYWDTTAPLVPIEVAWDGPGAETPAQIARDVRLRAEAARQVAESRAARGVL